MISAVILVPSDPDQIALWTGQCLAYCEAEGLHVAGMIRGEGDDIWPSVWDIIAAGTAQILVVARPEHLPPNRLPRIAVVADSPSPAGRRPRRRRA